LRLDTLAFFTGVIFTIESSKISSSSKNANRDQKQLYELIWKRATASQMADARQKRTKITANITEGGIPDFTVNGSRVMFDGWLKVDTAARGEDTEVPAVKTDDLLELLEINSSTFKTFPRKGKIA